MNNYAELNLKEMSLDELKELKISVEYDISKYHNLQQAKKISLNSLYGSFGSEYFRFYDHRIAEAITLMGQLANRFIERRVNEYLNKMLKTDKDYVVYQDTDSEFLCLSDIVEKHVPANYSNEKITKIVTAFCEEKLQKEVDKFCQELGDYVNYYSNRLSYKLEKVCSSGIFVAKKRYALNVYSNEGVVFSDPKVKVTGLEIIKSSTPKLVRTALKQGLKLILDENPIELQQHVKTFKQTFFKSAPEEIAFPRGVNGITTYFDQTLLYKKGTPIHVRGAILYNKHLELKKLNTIYENIKDGDKIKFIYLKLPNHFRENVISFQDKLPKEFGLHECIDYEIMFNTVFVKPLKSIAEMAKYDLERVNRIQDFF